MLVEWLDFLTNIFCVVPVSTYILNNSQHENECMHVPCALGVTLCPGGSRSTIEGAGRGRHNFVPVLGGDGTKISPPGDIFD